MSITSISRKVVLGGLNMLSPRHTFFAIPYVKMKLYLLRGKK